MEGNESYKISCSKIVMQILEAIYTEATKRKETKYQEELSLVINKIKANESNRQNANNSFIHIKIGLKYLKNSLSEIILKGLIHLISVGILDGNCADNCVYPEKGPLIIGKNDRKLIDGIIEALSQYINREKNEALILIFLKLICSIINNLILELHDRSLLEILKMLFFINISNQNQKIVDESKISLELLLSNVSLRIQLNANSKINNISNINNITNINKIPTSSPKSNQIIESNSELQCNTCNSQENLYVKLFVSNIVDNACIYFTTVKKIKKHYKNQINFLKESEGAKDLERHMRNILDSLPLTSIPNSNDPLKQKNNTTFNITITNEINIESGEYGWCFYCRKRAHLYCDIFKVPICSQECRVNTQFLINSFDNFTKHDLENNIYFDDYLMIFRSACRLSQSESHTDNTLLSVKSKILSLEIILCILDNFKLANFNFNYYNNIKNNNKNKNTVPLQDFQESINSRLSSEIIDEVAKSLSNDKRGIKRINESVEQSHLKIHTDLILSNEKNNNFVKMKSRNTINIMNSRFYEEFINIIKEIVSESILKNTLSSDWNITKMSLQIFFSLFNNFRTRLKNEISILIEEIFLKLLDSGNSTYMHKLLILDLFSKISESSKNILEIFINYDLEIENSNILERILEMLSKISQGKYTKSEHNYIIQPQEEQNLKLLALTILKLISEKIFSYLQLNYEAPSIPHDHSISESEKKESSIYSGTPFDNYEDTLKKKSIYNVAVLKFNNNPKHGIAFLEQSGLISKSLNGSKVKEVTGFINAYPSLNKTKIGEFFGEDIEFNKQVLSSYIDSLNFVKVPFVESIRILLSGFRLPGESQKIDRILRKFGEKYYHDNPSSFTNSDGPYELSFAVMILQTATHNPQIKKKMDYDEFMDMTRVIRKNYLIHDEIMKKIFDEIKLNPIVLADDEILKLRQESALAIGLKKKQDLFFKESQHYLKKTKQMFKNKKLNFFQELENSDCVKPLFEKVWGILLASFSYVLEETNNKELIFICLSGFKNSIKICSLVNLPIERDAFVSGLIRVSSIDSCFSIKDKSSQCFNVIMEIVHFDFNFIKNSWYYILEMLSKVDLYFTIMSGPKSEIEILSKDSLEEYKKKLSEQVFLNLKTFLKNIDPNNIENIYFKSTQLDDENIIDFIQALCQVSKEEINEEDNIRIYSLKKLIDVVSINMIRDKKACKSIWDKAKDLLIEVGSHKNTKLLNIGINSLRQLSCRFLSMEELKDMINQEEFLNPFINLLLHNKNNLNNIDYIIDSVSSICLTSGKYINTGWKEVWNLFSKVISFAHNSFTELSFKVI